MEKKKPPEREAFLIYGRSFTTVPFKSRINRTKKYHPKTGGIFGNS